MTPGSIRDRDAELPRTGYVGGPTPAPRFVPRTPSGDSGDSGSHGGSHHGGHYYYPFFGGHHFYPFYYPYYRPFRYFGLGYGYYGHDYGYYGHYPYPYVYRTRSVDVEPQGAIDLNVKPKDTQVYLDGYYVGTTGDFDGWPRYLWLDHDTHELIFYKEGYETVVREIAVRVDDVINLKMRMEPGVATPPEELTRYKDREDVRREPAYSSTGLDGEPAAGEDRQRDDYDQREYRNRDRRPPSPSAPAAGLDLRSEAGRLVLQVSPGEASVYIDGRFVGIGGELSALAAGLLMDPGEHRIQVFHPDLETQETVIEVKAGTPTELEITLKSP